MLISLPLVFIFCLWLGQRLGQAHLPRIQFRCGM
jgi:hypothetical protein